MEKAIDTYCKNNDLIMPQNTADRLKAVYLGLAHCYNDAIKELEKIRKCKFDSINIVGGGCRDGYLNGLTADITGLKVIAGPVEATSIGNVLCQMIYAGELSSLEEARKLVSDSFELEIYE